MNSIRFIVNSDDLGLSAEVNEAVAIAMQKGWVSRASLMTNMPGFDEAMEIIRKHNLYGRIGLHINVSEGIPLTYDIRKIGRFCDEEGKFINYKYKVKNFIKPFTGEEKRALRKEIIAQFESCESNGLTIRHVDSHHHQHIEWQFYNVLLDILREKKVVNSMRIARYSDSTVKNIYRYFINKSIDKNGYKTEDKLLSTEEIHKNIISSGEIVEIMCHPRLIDGIVMEENRIALEELINSLLRTYKGDCVMLQSRNIVV